VCVVDSALVTCQQSVNVQLCLRWHVDLAVRNGRDNKLHTRTGRIPHRVGSARVEQSGNVGGIEGAALLPGLEERTSWRAMAQTMPWVWPLAEIDGVAPMGSNMLLCAADVAGDKSPLTMVHMRR
jgi:hypothetical protein